MIAEYRRILKNPTPERKKKCIFFDALHKIYQAKDTNGVKAALNNYEEDYNLDPIDFTNEENDMNNGTNDDGFDGDGSGNDEDRSEFFSYAMSPSHVTMPPILNGTGNGDRGSVHRSTNGGLDHDLDESVDNSQHADGKLCSFDTIVQKVTRSFLSRSGA